MRKEGNRNLQRGRRLTGFSMRPSSRGECCTWWELDDLWQQSCSEHKELHQLTSEKKGIHRWRVFSSRFSGPWRNPTSSSWVQNFLSHHSMHPRRDWTIVFRSVTKRNLFWLLEPPFPFFLIFFLFFSSDCRHLRDDGKTGRTPWDSDVFYAVQTPACFARKIKGYEHHFNLPMAAVSFSFPFEWSNFWMRSLRASESSCPFAARTLVLYSPRTAKLTTWPRDSPSACLGVEGERGQSVHASRPMSVSRLFGATLRCRAILAAVNFTRFIDFASSACLYDIITSRNLCYWRDWIWRMNF